MRGQHAARLDQAVDVVRGRLPADEDHVVAVLAALGGRVGVEHDRPGGRARRGVQALRGDLDLDRRVEHRVQQLVELARIDPDHRFLARDHALPRHLDRDPQRGACRALARPRLQQVQRALLDRELDVLHVAVVRLEALQRRRQLGERLRQPLLHDRNRLRGADPRDDILSLGVDEELAVQDRLARRRIAGEADARAGALTLVPEHHLHHVDGRADVVGDLVGAPVDLRPRRVPRVEHGTVGAAQLLTGILGEAGADLLLVDPLERARSARAGRRR